MSANDRRSLIANLAFIALLALGLGHDVVALTTLMIGWVWVMLAIYVAAFAPPRKKSVSPLRPAWLFWTLDVTVLGILVWYGWIATAGAWIASIVVHDMACRRGRRLAWRQESPSLRADTGGQVGWRWVKRGQFPAPVRLSCGVTAWPVEAIESWEQQRKAETEGRFPVSGASAGSHRAGAA